MNTSALEGFPGSGAERLRNPEVLEVFPDRKSLISDIPEFPAGDGDHSLIFLTVH